MISGSTDESSRSLLDFVQCRTTQVWHAALPTHCRQTPAGGSAAALHCTTLTHASCADMLLATTLRENGADVLQPENLDADDVIARLTLHWRGVLLSGDRDMLRYVDLHGKEKRIMELFAFAPDGALVLVPRRDLVCRGTPLCALNVQLDLDLWRVAKCKTLKLVKDCAFYNRGNPDSFTRSHGNLHKLARGLRQALYAVLKARTVYETLPEWCEDTKDVKWVSTDVSGDAALAHEIRNPDLAYHWLASQEPLSCDEPSHTTAAPGRQDYRKWRSYTRAMLVAEYYASSLAKDTCMSDVIQIAQSVDPFFVRTIARGPPSNTPVHYLATACVRCGHNANCIHAELEYIWSHGMQLPKLCKTCRLARRANVTVVHRVKRGGRVSLQSRGGRSVVGVSMF